MYAADAAWIMKHCLLRAFLVSVFLHGSNDLRQSVDAFPQLCNDHLSSAETGIDTITVLTASIALNENATALFAGLFMLCTSF